MRLLAKHFIIRAAATVPSPPANLPHLTFVALALSQFRVFWCRVSLRRQNRHKLFGLEENEIEEEEGSSRAGARYAAVCEVSGCKKDGAGAETPFITSPSVKGTPSPRNIGVCVKKPEQETIFGHVSKRLSDAGDHGRTLRCPYQPNIGGEGKHRNMAR